MKRDEWEVTYTGSELAKAALLQRDRRSERLKWWSAKKDQVMKDIKETGIDVEESIAASKGYSISNTSPGISPRVTVRIDLQRRLAECHDKIMDHSSAVKDYEGWRQMMEKHNTQTFNLSHEDWLYFFGG